MWYHQICYPHERWVKLPVDQQEWFVGLLHVSLEYHFAETKCTLGRPERICPDRCEFVSYCVFAIAFKIIDTLFDAFPT